MTFESQVSTFIAIPVENCTKIECSPSTPSPTSIPSPEPTAFGPVESGEVAEDGNGNGGGEEDKDEEAGNSRKSKRELTRGFVA